MLHQENFLTHVYRVLEMDRHVNRETQMIPIASPDDNSILSYPRGFVDCEVISVCRTVMGDTGAGVTVSRWAMSEDELAEIVRTRCVYVVSMGFNPSPISLSVKNPLES